MKSNDKDNSPASPTVPSITCDSVFDSGRELSSDVYSTVGTGTSLCLVMINCAALLSVILGTGVIISKNAVFKYLFFI